MVHEAIQPVGWRLVGFANLGTRAIRSEVMEQSPSPDGAFSRGPMAMEETRAIQPTCHGIHMTIEHVAGAVSLRVGIGQGEAFGLGAQLYEAKTTKSVRTSNILIKSGTFFAAAWRTVGKSVLAKFLDATLWPTLFIRSAIAGKPAAG